MKVRRNFRVLVMVDEGYDKPSDREYEDRMLRRARSVCEQIGRHVDDIAGGASVEYDFYCDRCNLSWEQDADGIPQCCNAALADWEAERAKIAHRPD